MLLRARIVHPIAGPAMEDGAVQLSGGFVTAVGFWRNLAQNYSGPILDLGEVLLLPGLVNAHCHLDYTDMGGQPAPREFPDWIKGLLARKAAAGYADYAQAWLRGAAMLVRNGVTTVGDIEAVPELLPEVSLATPLRVCSFLEMTGVQSKRSPGEILNEAMERIALIPKNKSLAGLSPHALYSTTPDLLRQTAALSSQYDLRVAMHVAESAAEYAMYAESQGPLFAWLKNQRDMSDCGHGSPLQQVRQAGLLTERFICVHANYVTPEDIAAIAASGASVVHCPRSHAYFRHDPFPWTDFKNAGVNVALGTDSMASVNPNRPSDQELSLFKEMQVLAIAQKNLSPLEILHSTTVNAARSLGLMGKAGALQLGSWADLITLPYDGTLANGEAFAVHYSGAVRDSMIAGEWVHGSRSAIN